MAIMRQRAEAYLIDVDAIDLDELEACRLKELPAKISLRAKRPGLVRQRRQRLLLFVEAYARYLLFTDSKRFPGLVEECQLFQKMRKGKSKTRTGLIRCILGLKPNRYRSQQRKKVSEFYIAFRRLKNERVCPASLVETGRCVSDLLHPKRKDRGHSNAGDGSVCEIDFRRDVFKICVLRRSAEGKATLLRRNLVLDVESEADAVKVFEAAERYWKTSIEDW